MNYLKQFFTGILLTALFYSHPCSAEEKLPVYLAAHVAMNVGFPKDVTLNHDERRYAFYQTRHDKDWPAWGLRARRCRSPARAIRSRPPRTIKHSYTIDWSN